MSTATGRVISEPGLLVEIGLTPTVRLSSVGARTWNALSWIDADVDVDNLDFALDVIQALTLKLGDADNAFAALLLATVPTGLAVKVWVMDVSALATPDPVLVFDGQIDGLTADTARNLSIPCRVPSKMLPSGMLSEVLPAYFFAPEGTEIKWGNGTVKLERRQEYA